MFKTIGILGGTFDPVHNGHLRLALEILQRAALDHVRFIPCYQPVHRPPAKASAEHRLAMLQCAIENEPYLKIDERELQRQEPSYMIDTLKSLHAEYSDARLCLIVGNDAFLTFDDWRAFETIFQYCHIIVASRPSITRPTDGVLGRAVTLRETHEINDLHVKPAGCIFFQPIPVLDITSTDIRHHFYTGSNPRYLLPDSVYHYICKHSLYSHLLTEKIS